MSGRAVARANRSAIKSEIIPNQQLAEELHKPNRRFKKQKVNSSFEDNIMGCWSSRFTINK